MDCLLVSSVGGKAALSIANSILSAHCRERQCSHSNRRDEALVHLRHKAKTVEIDKVRHRFEIVTELLPRYPPPPVVLANGVALLCMSCSSFGGIARVVAFVQAAAQVFSSSAAIYSALASDPQPVGKLFVDASGTESRARSPVFVDSPGAQHTNYVGGGNARGFQNVARSSITIAIAILFPRLSWSPLLAAADSACRRVSVGRRFWSSFWW